MSQQLHLAMKDVLSMPYFKNEAAKSSGADHGHEAAVAERIKSAGFTEVSRSLFRGLNKNVIKKWIETGNDSELRKITKNLKPGSFILQPSGSQNFPDILILDFDNRFIVIECKSGKDGLCPMWNDNLPKPNAIYVLSSGKLNQTTLFLGHDVISQEEYNTQILFWKEQKQLEEKYRAIMKPLDKFNRGWDIKGRPQNFQGGGGTKSNYFMHSDRKKCEQNVLDFAFGCQ
jgi:hypothetical protein